VVLNYEILAVQSYVLQGYFNSREEAQKFIDDFYEPDPLTETYEKLYIIELESKL
jgi:hypothetical protein